MNLKSILFAAACAGAVSAAGYGLYRLGMDRGMGMSSASTTDSVGNGALATSAAATTAAPTSAPTPATVTADTGPMTIVQGEEATRRHITSGIKAGDIDPKTGKKILYYHDPMVPGNKFDKPAKSPFMDMMLVPVYADSDGDGSKVTVSARIQQNLGLRTVAVVEGTLSSQVSAVGSIAFNERDQAIVQARATGYVERLKVRATLDRVVKGQALAELYIPEWIAAQEEYLSVRRMQGTDLAALVDAARQRMRLVGMGEAHIAQVERSGQTQPRITLGAPIGGVITELLAREGMTVAAGATLFRISGLGTVWANAEVPESQSALLRPGTKVQARSAAAPETLFEGKVQAILPEVNPTTRTLKARVELDNAGGRLVPGMFVQMQFTDERAQKALLVPTEAIIQTGKRTVVILAEANGRFRPVEVDVGIESDVQTEIKRGLQAGQRIVVSSQFLIDSEASLKGVEARLNVESVGADTKLATGPVPTATPAHVADGVVISIDSHSALIKHGAVASAGMGAMTMEFMVPKTLLPKDIVKGQSVEFEFRVNPQGEYELTRITPIKNVVPPTPGDRK